MRVVLDTNVVISATLSPEGTPAQIINLIADNEAVQVCYSEKILAEYEEVLSRSKFRFSSEKQKAVIEKIKPIGFWANPPESNIPFTDESDRVFYDVAKSCGAILITGNIKHYPHEPFIMTPADFLNTLKNA